MWSMSIAGWMHPWRSSSQSPHNLGALTSLPLPSPPTTTWLTLRHRELRQFPSPEIKKDDVYLSVHLLSHWMWEYWYWMLNLINFTDTTFFLFSFTAESTVEVTFPINHQLMLKVINLYLIIFYQDQDRSDKSPPRLGTESRYCVKQTGLRLASDCYWSGLATRYYHR